MNRLSSLAVALVFVLSLANVSSFVAPVSPAAAQTQNTPPPPAPSRMQRVKAKTKETWEQMKARWAAQRERSRDCRQQARAQRLHGRKVRKFLDECMSR